MTRLAFTIVMAIVASGCLTSTTPPRDVQPEADQESREGLRRSMASATYAVQAVSGEEGTARLDLRPSPIWTASANIAYGQIVTFEGPDWATLSARAEGDAERHLAVDNCGGPAWGWFAEDGVANFIRGPDPLTTILALDFHDLPRSGEDQRTLRRAGWQVMVTRTGHQTYEVDWFDSTYDFPVFHLSWQSDQPFPERVWRKQGQDWTLGDFANEGDAVICSELGAYRPALMVNGWGPLGPVDDPPLGYSFAGLIEHLLEDPTQVELQRYRSTHSDMYLATGNALNAPVTPLQSSEWQDWLLSFHAPGASDGPAVTCSAADGGAEAADRYTCDVCTGRFSGMDIPTGFDWNSLLVADWTGLTALHEALGEDTPELFFRWSFEGTESWNAAPGSCLPIPDVPEVRARAPGEEWRPFLLVRWDGGPFTAHWDHTAGQLLSITPPSYEAFIASAESWGRENFEDDS